MSVPPEAANDTLKVILVIVQSLMKRCIKVKEGDPEALKLSDEIARRVARDLKLYAGTATSFSPLLLSCATIIRQYSRGGAFQSVPDWTSVTDDDPQIKDHLRFQKTVHYHPPSALDVPVIATSSIPTMKPIQMTLRGEATACPRPEQDDQPAPANIADPEPTARDILQGIRDLSKRLDLFAINDCVDALEIRVRSVENILHQRLNALEQCLNASDAR
ncbi:uncharacterized protein F5891DRAFT_988856 [Suillus fuscotomentosus]|uniref:Uncharacterized protein n=1 Tax=Suillus fuscotomentosus TaxID=1912939 RepID=A0AAD4HC25_9AGAM|nr:uncharacterized protein F5891DRAFT_988856 [Suillus fuscotomentosus]KAG1886436.1 hypothetical protein F5891DRAFT_988856 [Suillus fuscotomentosus]